jgi:hypothetical protein
MFIKKGIFFIFLCFVVSSFSFAKQISFQIIQHDISNEKVNENSYAVEDELLTYFFEQGYIVTNSPAAVSSGDSQDKKLWSTGFSEAFDGSSDYFIQVVLSYSDIEVKDSLKLENAIIKLDWTLTSVKSGKEIQKSFIKNNNKDSFKIEDIKSMASLLVSEINKVI